MSDKRKLNVYSRHITEPKSQGASQAMLYGTGLTAADMHKPQVGIASVWYEGNTCNMHLLDLAAAGQGRRRRQRAWSACASTPSASATASRWAPSGMSYSLQSRDLIADSIETVDGRAVVRRARHAARLRQEHARLPDGDGPAEPPVADGLRRHDQARLSRQGKTLDVISRVPELRRVPRRRASPTASASDIVDARVPRRRRVRRHVHRQHDGDARSRRSA